ncbi:Mucin-associated surface protein (MASP), subgroup S043 [Trypanosoma cruzi]|nr:Mucin-associated surface protein (MASP), subgroup S043 [Trypanosoma cruzi]
MAMMMTSRVLLVCALCVLWCGVCGVYARNPDNNSLGGYMASGGFGRNKSFLSTGFIKNFSTPLLLSASFISAIQAEAREEVSSTRVTNSPLSGATGFGTVPHAPVPAIPGAAVPGHFADAIPGPSPVRVPGAVPGAAVSAHAAAAFSGPGAAAPGNAADAIPGPGPSPAFSGPVRGAAVPGHGTAGPGAVRGAAGHGTAIPGAAIPGAIPGYGAAGPVPGAAGHGHGPAAIPGSPVPGHSPGATPGSPRGPAVPGDDAAVPAFSGLGDAVAEAGPGAAAVFSSLGAAVPGHAAGPAGAGAAAAFSGGGHSVLGGSEPPDSRPVVISSNEGGNGKTAPVSVSSDEQIVSPQEVLAQKETGSQHTSSPEGQPTVSSNNEKQRNNFASAGGRSLGHDAAGDELQDSLEEQKKNDHSQTNETKKSSGDQITESQRSGKELSEVSNTTTHGVKTQRPKTNSVNEKNYSQNTDASHTTSPLLLLLLVVVCAAAAAVVAA